MLFSGIPFLFYFFPAVIILYLITPRVLKNATLLLCSLFFYGWGEPRLVPLMLVAILCAYLFGLLIEKFAGTLWSRIFLALSVTVSIGMLGYFKYVDFFIESFNAATGLGLPFLNVALPIGISFYTFQAMSYTIDVYRGDTTAQKNPVTLATYVALFPQLIAGPIVRYSDVAEQLSSRTHTVEKTAEGVRRFMLGLGKKVLIANVLGEFCEAFRATQQPSVVFTWVYGIAFALQIYFDFSGYSDMAIGLGKFFGFTFMENFNYPFVSKSISEFWRRWHISLGSWFRDYVYIPLGGSRVSSFRWVFNFFVVWMLTGLWHGAAWNFVLWGLYFAVMLAVERLLLAKILPKLGWTSHLYTLFFILISFVIFDSPTLSAAAENISRLFGGAPLMTAETAYWLKNYGVVLILAAVGATPLVKTLTKRLPDSVIAVAEPVVLTALLLLSTAYLVDGSFNPFLYFRF